MAIANTRHSERDEDVRMTSNVPALEPPDPDARPRAVAVLATAALFALAGGVVVPVLGAYRMAHSLAMYSGWVELYLLIGAALVLLAVGLALVALALADAHRGSDAPELPSWTLLLASAVVLAAAVAGMVAGLPSLGVVVASSILSAYPVAGLRHVLGQIAWGFSALVVAGFAFSFALLPPSGDTRLALPMAFGVAVLQLGMFVVGLVRAALATTPA